MGQVPTLQKPYLIVGGGRLASHISHYFKLLDIPFYCWHRNHEHPLSTFLTLTEKVLLAVSDDAIEPLSETIPQKTTIHFSGALTLPKVESAHPLFTFGPDLYDLGTYRTIPFITEKGRLPFSDLFPDLPNVSYEIDAEKKPVYHAWTSIAGNFSSILIMEYVKKLEAINLPASLAKPYLTQVLKNSFQSQTALTGPIARGDEKTIRKHLDVIDDDFKLVYESFVNLYRKRAS